MASFYLREYSSIASANGKPIPVPKEPPHSTETVTYSTSAQSAAFADNTQFIGVYAPAACYVEFGSNPTAVATSIPLEANKFYFFGVSKGHKIAIYDGSS